MDTTPLLVFPAPAGMIRINKEIVELIYIEEKWFQHGMDPRKRVSDKDFLELINQ